MLQEFKDIDFAEDRPDAGPARLPWIETRSGHPYFFTEGGQAWTPIGHNDAITWPELSGLYRRRDVPAVERHLLNLRSNGVTCLRLMLEYCQTEHRYIEKPVGTFTPNLVRMWDDLFAMCERLGMRILLTPYDTFFTWIRWKHHPYNRRNGGPCGGPGELLSCPETRKAIRARLEFAVRRWGASPALFGWDIWNEMHPAHAGNRVEPLADFISDLAPWLKATELRLFGRRHPVTVSVFGPELLKSPELNAIIFRHPELDFANTHLYEAGTIDRPRNTIAPALAAGRLIAAAIAETADQRPVFDSEHGPIHSFKDRKTMLPEAFDDEYFRHIQWAHLASGGAGGGMRWPNRRPHVLTPGMREAQSAMSRFLPLIDWTKFNRRCWNGEIELAGKGVAAFGCGDGEQAIFWFLRTDATGRDGRIKSDGRPKSFAASCRAPAGTYRLRFFDTKSGAVASEATISAEAGRLPLPVADLASDVAVALTAIC